MAASTKHIDMLNKAFAGFKDKVNEWRRDDLKLEAEAIEMCLMKHQHKPLVGEDNL